MYLLTIIVAAYNAEKHIEECISSFLKQRNIKESIRLIIVNDGSNDNTSNIINRFCKKHNNIFVITKENGGLSSARNAGIKYATRDSTYISFLDADDILSLSYLDEFFSAIKKFNPDIIEFNVKRFSDLRSVIIKPSLSIDNIFTINDANFAKVSRIGLWYACARIYRTELFVDNLFIEGKRYEDVALIPTIYLKAKKCYSSSKALYHYRDNPLGITRNPTIGDMDDITFAYKYFKKNNETQTVEMMRKSITQTFIYVSRGFTFREILFSRIIDNNLEQIGLKKRLFLRKYLIGRISAITKDLIKKVINVMKKS